MPAMVEGQPARFVTILFYLNEDMVGGETAFPRWYNADTSQSLKIKPERGKAILFYNMLPDGNYDERSQHAALKVTSGEKYIANLWVWDPVLDQYVNIQKYYGCFVCFFILFSTPTDRISVSNYCIVYRVSKSYLSLFSFYRFL
jgi:2OG-Fe(II) oxygenase superfamily